MPTLPTKTEIEEELRKLVPPWIEEDELALDVVGGLAAALEVASTRAETRFARVLLATSAGEWLDVLAREHGESRLLGETDASLRVRGRIRARGVTPPGILAEIAPLLRAGQGCYIVEPDAGPLSAPRATFLDRTIYLDRPTHIFVDEPWHFFALLVEWPPVVWRELAFLDRGAYLDRPAAAVDGGPFFLDTAVGDPDENVLVAIWRVVERSRAAGIRFKLYVLD